MIAHRITRTSAKDSFEKLACYVADLKGKRDPNSFDRLATYMAGEKGDSERVVGLRVTNCEGEDFRASIDEIEAVQARNTRSKADRSYHLVISFPEGERPTLAQLHDIEDRLCEAIGLADHQRISAIHDDTDHLHVHVAINKIHPTTFRCVEPYFDHPKLMAACAELEVKHELIRVNHGQAAEKKLNQKSAKMEAHAGRETLHGWIMTEAAEHLKAGLTSAATWAELHAAFAKQGLEIRQHGAGLVIGVPGERTSIKASALGREFAVGALTKRFGAFEGRSPQAEQVKPERQYTRAPKQRSPEAKALFERYQAERAAALAARRAGREDLDAAHATYSAELRRHYGLRRATLRGDVHMRADEKKRVRVATAAEQRADWARRRALAKEQRAGIDLAHPLPTWQGFLQREASHGDEHALAALRSQATSRSRLADDILTAADVTVARHIIDRRHRSSARKNGDLVYDVQDGGRVTDRTAEVRMDQLSTGAAFLALSLAAARFDGQPLILEGTDAFKAAIVEVSTLPGFNVRFADPALEEARKVAGHAREAMARPTGGDAPSYVAERNLQRTRFADIPEHRLWTTADVGEFAYAGRRAFPNGTEAVLLKRGDTLYVKPSSDAQVAKASKWQRGRVVHLDGQGRFVSQSRGAQSRSANERA